MAFRKRNIPIRTAGDGPPEPSSQKDPALQILGTRPSPLDGRLTTSTGTSSLDELLAGHAGLVLGNSLLIEESGTTDYAGALLRCFAAEGLVQSHVLHLVGVPRAWTQDLPSVATSGGSRGQKGREGSELGSSEKMKIAWRYERSGGSRDAPPASKTTSSDAEHPFCHTFDLARRLEVPSDAKIFSYPVDAGNVPGQSPFAKVIQYLLDSLQSSPAGTLHRVVVPTMLSPALYPPQAAEPENVLQFMHALRALLSSYPQSVVAMATLPLELFPRPTGLVAWMEILADGVMELTPFPHRIDLPSGKVTDNASAAETSSSKTGPEEQPQGMFKVHKLPIFHERGGSAGNVEKSLGNDLAFTMSRRRFLLRPYSLPPELGDVESQQGASQSDGEKISKDNIDF